MLFAARRASHKRCMRAAKRHRHPYSTRRLSTDPLLPHLSGALRFRNRYHYKALRMGAIPAATHRNWTTAALFSGVTGPMVGTLPFHATVSSDHRAPGLAMQLEEPDRRLHGANATRSRETYSSENCNLSNGVQTSCTKAQGHREDRGCGEGNFRMVYRVNACRPGQRARHTFPSCICVLYAGRSAC